MTQKIILIFLLSLICFSLFSQASIGKKWIEQKGGLKDEPQFDSAVLKQVAVYGILIIIVVFIYWVYNVLKLPSKLLVFKKGKYSSYSDDPVETGEYDVLVSGIFVAKNVMIKMIKGMRKFTPEIRNLIDEEWEISENSGKELDNRRAFGLISAEKNRDKLQLKMQETSFKDFYGTNIRHPLHPEVQNNFANIIAFSVLVVTIDKKILIEKRSHSATQYKNHWDLINADIMLKE